MEKEIIEQLINKGRSFQQYSEKASEEFVSDQQKKLPQPPLVKAPVSKEIVALPKNFEDLDLSMPYHDILIRRKSNRVYTDEKVSLLELSYLLWSTQGIKDIRGKAYATIRTVPSGGARHTFETYMFIRNVEGLKNGLYHYLPLKHEIEYLKEIEDIEEVMNQVIGSQAWVKKAAILFCYTTIPYRAEWRYGIFAHRTVLIDLGHVSENMYLSSTILHLGTCASACFEGHDFASIADIDENEEYLVYTMPVGKVKDEDITKEKAFYSFVEEEGL